MSLSQTIFSWVIIMSDKMIPLKYQTTSPLLQKESEGMGVGPQQHIEKYIKRLKDVSNKVLKGHFGSQKLTFKRRARADGKKW